jgi:hypothetical protein
MTLSRNEQIALYILIFLVISIAGLFIFLLPANKKIGENNEILAARRAALEKYEKDLGLAAFEQVEKDIFDAYEAGKDSANNFHNEEYLNFQADRMIQGILADAGLSTSNMKINDLTTYNLALTIFRPTDILYDIKEAATIGTADGVPVPAPPAADGEDGEGTDAATAPAPAPTADISEMKRILAGASRRQALTEYERAMESVRNGESGNITALDVAAAMREYLSTQTETVLARSVSFEIPITREELEMLSQHIFELELATYVLRVSYKELPNTGGSAPPAADGDDDAPPPPTPQGGGDRKLFDIEVMFLIAEPMNEPSGHLTFRDRFTW